MTGEQVLMPAGRTSRTRARQLAPQQRRQGEAEEEVNRPPPEVGVNLQNIRAGTQVTVMN